MPTTSSLELSTSLMLSVAIAAIAVILGLRQWWEHRVRDADLSDVDHKHFFWQDLRRVSGVLLMLILALGIYVGSRIPPIISDFPLDADDKQAIRAVAGTWVDTWINGEANPRFVGLWFVVIVVLMTLLALALFDWRATRRYARRERQALAGERLKILRDTFRRADSHRNGHPQEPEPDLS
jgi:hypothetical protein